MSSGVHPEISPEIALSLPLVGVTKPLLAPATVLLVAAAVSGCGPFGDDGGEDGATGEEDFVARGDEICRDAQERVAEIQRDLPTSRQESARFAESLIDIFAREVGELQALDPPVDQREAFDRYLDARGKAIGFLRDGLEAAERNDPEGYADAQAQVAAGQVDRAELAQQAGLRGCSRPLTGGSTGD
jgi:hypothetical protein